MYKKFYPVSIMCLLFFPTGRKDFLSSNVSIQDVNKNETATAREYSSGSCTKNFTPLYNLLAFFPALDKNLYM